ncbi:hypothetical protein L1049_023937 [Liquidambar formosana]|uniref:Uncharacterized protein n=1 Tax=Liquidambar formosana TaxID=63359 RepID=A0AAP0RTZ7_LIQFO
MGLCVSSESAKRKGGGRDGESIKLLSTAKVIHVDGRVQEFNQPILAGSITSQNPNCFLCSSESMSIGTCVPHVREDEELHAGQIYFLMPLSRAHTPLSLPDLCSLAIKASSTMTKDEVQLLSSKPRLVFR